jgi:large subunit ribosomal protein L13
MKEQTATFEQGMGDMENNRIPYFQEEFPDYAVHMSDEFSETKKNLHSWEDLWQHEAEAEETILKKMRDHKVRGVVKYYTSCEDPDGNKVLISEFVAPSRQYDCEDLLESAKNNADLKKRIEQQIYNHALDIALHVKVWSLDHKFEHNIFCFDPTQSDDPLFLVYDFNASVLNVPQNQTQNKTTYTPHMDDGDFVVVKNIEKIKFSGNKYQNKKYYKHTGYPGGIKETTPEKLSLKNPEEILKLAVKRMLPSGPLAKKQLTKLKIYKGDQHPHEVQKPIEISLLSENQKNIFRS